MSSPGSRPKKSGFMAGLQAAMVPTVPADDGKPLVRPGAVTVASVLVMIAGLLFLALGALWFSTASSQVDLQAKAYVKVIAQCSQFFGGYGTAVPSSAAAPSALPETIVPATALPGLCRTLTEPTQSETTQQSYRSSIRIFSVVLILIGLATAISGWFLRDGRRWARRVLIAVVVVQLALAFLLQVSNLFTLVATLLVVIGMSITFLGRASGFFLAVAIRKKAH